MKRNKMDETDICIEAMLSTTPAMLARVDAIRDQIVKTERYAVGHADTAAFIEALSKQLARLEARLVALDERLA